MLTADPRLGHLDLAWSTSAMAEVFSSRVLPELEPDAQLQGLEIEDVTYSPGRQCFVLYRLGLTGDGGPIARHAVVTFAKDARLAARVHASDGGGEARRSYLENENALVELFPTDWHLPTLGSVLGRGSSAFGRRGVGDDGSVSTTVLHYCAHRRCVMRVRGSGVADSVAKLYRTGEEATDAWSRLCAVNRVTTGFAIPAPLHLRDDLHMFVMADAGGVELHDLLSEDPTAPALREVVHDAGVRLASFHRNGPVGLPQARRTIADDIESLRTRTRRVHLVADELGARVHQLLDRLSTASDRLEPDIVVIHGDFKPSQILVTTGNLTLVDFDRSSTGDRVVDVGNFVGQLRKLAITTGSRELRVLASEFLEAYRRSSDCVEVPGVDLVTSLSLARLAVRAVRHAPHEYATGAGDALPDRLLDEAESCLT